MTAANVKRSCLSDSVGKCVQRTAQIGSAQIHRSVIKGETYARRKAQGCTCDDGRPCSKRQGSTCSAASQACDAVKERAFAEQVDPTLYSPALSLALTLYNPNPNPKPRPNLCGAEPSAAAPLYQPVKGAHAATLASGRGRPLSACAQQGLLAHARGRLHQPRAGHVARRALGLPHVGSYSSATSSPPRSPS